MPTFSTQSWTGNQYQEGSLESMILSLMFPDGASYWAQTGGNASGMDTAILQCPCLLQASATTPTSVPPSGNDKTYLLLAGDSGLNLGPGHNHSVGQLFNLAAETKVTELTGAGNNNVITQRISSVSATYVYDAEGRRARKTASGSTSDFVFDLQNQIISQITGSVWTRGELFVDGRHLATYTNGTGGTTLFNHTDWLGTERIRTTTAGASAETFTSLPFGDALNQIGSSPVHLTGKEREAESGLDYFGTRDYSSTMARFTNPDPVFFQSSMLTDPQQFNLYAYVRNCPPTLTDPKGEAIELSGDEQERKKQIQTLQEAVGPQAGAYLYENKVESTDANGNKSTNYYVGVYTNGPDGKGPAFGNINSVASTLGDIINDSRVAVLNLAQAGTTVRDMYGSSTVIGSIPGSPGATYVGLDGKMHVTLLDTSSTFPGQLPPNYMSNSKPGPIDGGILAGHEFGHVRYEWGGFWRHALDTSNSSAVRLENDVRQQQDPSAPTRTQH